MAAIIPVPRIKGTRYKAVIRLTGIKPYSRTFKTRKAAEHWAREQESDIDLARAGGDVQAQRMTLAELCDDYMLHGWKGKDQGRQYHVRWWREQLGYVRLRDLSKQQVRDELRLYKAGRVRRYDGAEANGKPKTKEVNKSRSPASVNRLRGALDAVLKFGRQEYDYARNPTANIPKEREDNQRKQSASFRYQWIGRYCCSEAGKNPANRLSFVSIGPVPYRTPALKLAKANTNLFSIV